MTNKRLYEIKADIDFLKQMKSKLQQAIDKKDSTLFDYVFKMIGDWEDELNRKIETSEKLNKEKE